jgi:two-component system sensor histidine kinase BarA
LHGLAAAELNAGASGAERDEILRFVQPVLPASHYTVAAAGAGADSEVPLGWVAIEYSRQPYIIQSYRALLVGSLIITLALVGTFILVVFAGRRLDRAMTALRQGIERIKNGQFDTPVHAPAGGELQVLAQDINRMAAKLHNADIELQRNLEQTNRDLRESLETVEVQNIELDLARREALEASRIKSEFLANTSHELRTPLNGIIGFTKLLLKSALDPRQREYLETIR